MKIGYLVVREDIFSDLMKTQVIELLKIQHIMGQDVYLIWLFRLDYLFRYKIEQNNIFNYLKQSGITLVKVPIIVNKFPLSRIVESWLSKYVSFFLEKLVKKFSIDILHARGYDAGFILKEYKKRHTNMKIVFDPRSPFLTEIQTTYGISKDTDKYKFWEKAEKEIIEASNATIAISKDFQKYLNMYKGKVIYVPNNVKMIKKNELIRLFMQNKRLSICYVGSMGYGWNDARVYANYVSKFLIFEPKIKFEFYVRELGGEILKREFQKKGIDESNYLITTLAPEKIQNTIVGCIAGLQLMGRRDDRLGVKTVEYLAAGIPLICNNNAIGAKKIVQDENLGFNIDETDIDQILIRLKNETFFKRCFDYAYDNFSNEVIAKKYKGIYLSLKNKE